MITSASAMTQRPVSEKQQWKLDKTERKSLQTYEGKWVLDDSTLSDEL